MRRLVCNVLEKQRTCVQRRAPKLRIALPSLGAARRDERTSNRARRAEYHPKGPTPKLGTTWEQLRPNTGQSGGVGPTRKQDESTR